MIFRDQLLGNCRVLHPLADFARDEITDQRIGLGVGQDIAVIRLPDAKARFGVALFPKGFAFFWSDFKNAARIGIVDIAARRGAQQREKRRIIALDLALFFFRDWAVMQRRAPIGRTLKNRERSNLRRNGLDHLHTGRTRANHRHALAGEAHGFMWPAIGMEGLAGKAFNARDARQRISGKRAKRGDQEAAVMLRARIKGDCPALCGFIEMRADDAAIELDMAAQIEPVCHVLQIAECFGLRREMLAPAPFLQQLIGKGIAIGVAFGIKPRAGVAVPIPGAAQIAAGLKNLDAIAKLPQAIELIEAGNAGADDDDIGLGQGRAGVCRHGSPHFIHRIHPFQRGKGTAPPNRSSMNPNPGLAR